MKNNLKAIVILLSLSIVWYGVSSVASFYRTINSVKTIKVETEIGIGGNTDDIVEDIIQEDTEPVKGTCPECEQRGKVLGSKVEDCIGEGAYVDLVTFEVIIDGSGAVDFEDGSSGGDLVRKNAVIEVAEVTVPLVLLSGTSRVEDSNQLISMDSAALKASGNLFHSDYGRKLESPSTVEEYDEKVEEGIFKEVFGGEVEMKFKEKPEPSVARINMETGAESVCLDCQNSNYTPDISNIIASELNETINMPGGQREVSLNEELFLDLSSGIIGDIPKAQYGCRRSFTSPIVELLARIKAEVFTRCREENSGECVRVKDIVVRTSSFYGDYETCKDEDKCTNVFMNKRSLSTLSPPSASDFDQDFLVTTKCKVRIDGALYGVPCLWDVQYIAHEWYHQWQSRNPGKEFPEWSVYWEVIEEEMLRRGDS